MKRIVLTFCALFLVFNIYHIRALCVTAPDNNDYAYVYQTYDNGINIYSNKKICGCSQFTWVKNGETRYQVISYANHNNVTYAGTLQSLSGQAETQIVTKYPNTNYQFYTSDYIAYKSNDMYPDSNSNLYVTTTSYPALQIFDTMQECYEYLTTPDVDFENLYYDPTIPTPNFVVTLERPTPWNDVNTMTNFFNVVWNDNASYYIEIGYKYAVPNSMQVGLSEGNVIYTPLTYYESNYRNIYELSDLHVASGLNNDVNSSDFLWSAVQITDPSDWSTTVPVWANSYNVWQGKRDNWNNKLAYCMPLYGLRLEIFARYFYVLDSEVYVGSWKHWNNSYPNQYGEELPDNYQVGNSMPGYENTNNNVDYQEQTNTITSIGTQTGQDNTPTVIVNNLTPNYPDYPTVATYNHDNLLLQFFTTAKQLPTSFNGFTNFLAASFTWIPSYIWDIIAFGLLASITVMVIKIL